MATGAENIHPSHPRTGRFTQPSPSGQQTNPYLYANGDPVNQIDPTGLAWYDPVLRVAEKSLDFALAGGIGGCVTTAEIGCWEGAAVGGFGGAIGGITVGIRDELK